MNCVFCEIVNGKIPSQKVFENDKILAFKDISPMAPVHVVIIPKEHIESVNQINDANSSIITEIFNKIPKIAQIMGVEESGYRIITNYGDDGCQSVKHMHFHLLGGKKLPENLA
ncbi:histidine triad nucleotide-binding protein [Sedimentibacter sp. zth1]|uniref:histidine triad nucleotide-binding protein n=1 Tax=Sedimentibacter sp. zth1 TaxID=2816908 RepID=UPI001A912425|nr:histidine triad nucleotide-binding protein [Sedimentibacter sp. zth1]QSX06845.1 histidine triad nucleotide-binding protein [Sedimentibacter sp. zth1]